MILMIVRVAHIVLLQVKLLMRKNHTGIVIRNEDRWHFLFTNKKGNRRILCMQYVSEKKA